ncbi:hypothetical protein ACK1XI_005098, partial [Salmonella enterica]
MSGQDGALSSSSSLIPCTAAAAGSMLTVGFSRVSNIFSPRAFTRPISSACAPAS